MHHNVFYINFSIYSNFELMVGIRHISCSVFMQYGTHRIQLMTLLFDSNILFTHSISVDQYFWLSTNVNTALRRVNFSIRFWREKIESKIEVISSWWAQYQRMIRHVFSSLEDYLTPHICYYCIRSGIPNMAYEAVMVLFV